MTDSESISTYPLSDFGLSTMTRFGAALRALGDGAEAMEDVADHMVRHLYDGLVDDEGGARVTALVRFYKTHPFGELDERLRDFARARSGAQELPAHTKCLTLLATAGERPEWSSREGSVGHRAIPLSSERLVEDSPMIANLIQQLGMDVASLAETRTDLMIDREQHTHNVFYVPEAVGSPLIPAQSEFVIPFGVRSVLGFGGLLPGGDLFAVVVFWKVHLPRETAALFRTLSLSARLAVLPFSEPGKTFRGNAGDRDAPAVDELTASRLRVAGLEQLLSVQETLVIEQAGRIERANAELARLASTDALTGVANHRVFMERIGTEHRRAVRERTALGLLMIDIDHFKPFNDTLGHVAGDECLAAVAEALEACLNRGTDLVARYGGEEFAVILPETSVEGVAHLAAEMRGAVEGLARAHPASPVSPVVTISVGGLVEVPDRSSTVDGLIQRADALLYRAKSGGRNRVIVEPESR